MPGDAGLVQVKNVDEFVHKELILHSLADNVRSIANLMDGLKPSQRKILFACLKRNLPTRSKVNQLAGYVSEHTDYHHGEASLVQAIIHMAQHFRGANNLPLLQDNGQFGTRLLEEKITLPEDTSLQNYHQSLVISFTSTMIQSYQRQIMNPCFMLRWCPWSWSTVVRALAPVGHVVYLVMMCTYCGFMCSSLVESTSVGGDVAVECFFDGWYQMVFEGTLEVVSDYTYRITELPEGVWTSTYKEWLENQVFVSRVEDRSTESTVDMTVKTNKKLNTPKQTLKLIKSVSKQSMVLFDVNNRLKKYESVLQIMDEYCKQRLMMYDARLIHVTDQLEAEIKCAREKAQVIEWIVQGVVKSLTLEEDLIARGMDPERYLSLTYRQTTAKAVERLHQKIKDLEIGCEVCKRVVSETSVVE